VLFLLLNATLFLRPAEIIPQLTGLPIYEVVILTCLALSLPSVLRQFRYRALMENPITLCVLGMLPAIVLSHLSKGDTWYARTLGTEFIKVILYYLLLVGLVNTPGRLRQFLIAITVFALVLTVVSLLRYHGVIELATIAPLEQEQAAVDPATGTNVVVARLQAAGIYANPNDLARIIVVGITLCLFGMSRKGARVPWVVWLPPLLVFVHALRLTYSRGGLLALVAGIMVLFFTRYGKAKGAAALVVLLPALLLFSGRQTDISTSKDTGQSRIKLWSHGLVAMRSAPVFGIGADRYFKMAGNHAHNSFLEAFVETGLVGGVIYTGAFFLAATGLHRLKSEEMKANDPALWRMRPYVLSLVVGTIVGQLSSSREYSLPTYMILGLVSVYLSLAARRTPGSVVRMSPLLAVRLAVVGVTTLLVFHFYTKATAHFGG
jgi:O-antigen ligase